MLRNKTDSPYPQNCSNSFFANTKNKVSVPEAPPIKAFSRDTLFLIQSASFRLLLFKSFNQFVLDVARNEFVACKLHDEAGTSSSQ